MTTRSHDHAITRSHNHTITWSHDHMITQSHDHSIRTFTTKFNYPEPLNHRSRSGSRCQTLTPQRYSRHRRGSFWSWETTSDKTWSHLECSPCLKRCVQNSVSMATSGSLDQWKIQKQLLKLYVQWLKMSVLQWTKPLSCECHVMYMWLMWLPCDCHVTVMWLSCDCPVMCTLQNWWNGRHFHVALNVHGNKNTIAMFIWQMGYSIIILKFADRTRTMIENVT